AGGLRLAEGLALADPRRVHLHRHAALGVETLRTGAAGVAEVHERAGLEGQAEARRTLDELEHRCGALAIPRVVEVEGDVVRVRVVAVAVGRGPWPDPAVQELGEAEEQHDARAGECGPEQQPARLHPSISPPRKPASGGVAIACARSLPW